MPSYVRYKFSPRIKVLPRNRLWRTIVCCAICVTLIAMVLLAYPKSENPHPLHHNRNDDILPTRRKSVESNSSVVKDIKFDKIEPKIQPTTIKPGAQSMWRNISGHQTCPFPSPLLSKEGRVGQAILLIPRLREIDVIESHSDLNPGGEYRPTQCIPMYKVAIVLPYRDRQSHLTRFLDYVIPILKRQLLDFRFIVTEQYGRDLFNKGRIMNAAFTLAESLAVDCVIFHDVDMFPQDDRIDYSCPSVPMHLGAYVSSLGYELWYNYLVGGVLAMRMDHYRQVNGYSNSYWGWGGEDDDMGKRLFANKFVIQRPPKQFATYSMIRHVKRQRNLNGKIIYGLLEKTDKNFRTDGVAQVSWKILKVTKTPLYYHIYVDVGSPPEKWKD